MLDSQVFSRPRTVSVAVKHFIKEGGLNPPWTALGLLKILTGEWRLTNGGAVTVGTERWRLEETTENVTWSSMNEKSAPFPHKEGVRVTALPRKWRVKTIHDYFLIGESRGAFRRQTTE